MPVPTVSIPRRHPRRRLSSSDGFTLIEVACAAFVMLFAIASSIVAMQTGFRSLDYARGLTLASQIIQSEIENIRMKPIEQIITMVGTAEVPIALAPEISNRFTVTRRITRVGTSEPRLYEVVLTIEWKTVDQITHRRSTSTRYSEFGLNDFFGTDPRRVL